MTLAMLCKLTCSYHSDESADGCLANLKDQQTGHAVRSGQPSSSTLHGECRCEILQVLIEHYTRS